MKRRILSMLLAFVMLLGMLPGAAFATGEAQSEKVYISISYNGRYTEDKNGTPVAYVPVELDALAAIDLNDYGLGEYLYDADSDGNYEITALHLYIYVHETIFGSDWSNVGVSGGAGSIFFEYGLFDFVDCNLQYYYNGEYPAVDGWGITADQLVLSDGDFLDIAGYTSWSFYSDPNAGFHFFLDGQGTELANITHAYTLTAGEELTVTLARTAQDVTSGGATMLVPEDTSNYCDADYNPLPIYYGTTLYADGAASAEIDSNGQATITFDAAGTYYIWADGGYGEDGDYNGYPDVVSSPAYAVVTVEAAEAPETYPVTITAPLGSTVSVGTMRSYFVYNFEDAVNVSEDQTAGTVTYGFNVPTTYGNTFVRVQNPQGVTYWDYTSLEDGTSITITEDMLFMNDSKHSADTIIRDFSEYEHDVADVYINANEKGYINLSEGETFEFNVFRDWHAVEGISNAKTALPDVSYQIIDINGNFSDVVTVVPDENNSSVATMTANKEGVAIVLVTYDAMYSTLALRGRIGTDEAAPAFFSAIWPENTGVLVVTVDADGSAIQTNMMLNSHALDAEHDVLYYVGDEGASYTFTPEADCKVSVARAELTEDSLTYNGFTTDGVIEGDNGEWTVTGLTAGSHIIRVEKNGVFTYQVICTKQTTVVVTDSEGNEINEDNPADPGETLTIQLGDLYNPLNKLSGVYNSNCRIIYTGENSTAFSGEPGSGYGYYLFAADSDLHKVTVTLPEIWAYDTYSLTGCLSTGGFGSGAGAHRTLTYAAGKNEETNAPATSGMLGRLPEIVIPVNASESVPATGITLSETVLSMGIGGTTVLTATVTPEDTTDFILWSSSDDTIVTVDDNGVVTGVSAGEAIITATAGDVSASCTVTVSEETVENIVLVTRTYYDNDIYLTTMDLQEIAISGVTLSGDIIGVDTDDSTLIISDECTIPVVAGDYQTVTVTLKPALGMGGSNSAAQGKLYYYCNDTFSEALNTYEDYIYTTTVSLNWENDTAVLVVGTNLNQKTVKSTYTITFVKQAAEPENSVPALADGVNATATVSIEVGGAYTVDLGTIFTDADGDALTYQVSVNGADTVAADAQYSYMPDAAGTVTLVFTANDGKADSVSYTVTLTVTEVEKILSVPEISVTLNSKDKPIISWDAVDGAEKYEVWRAVGEGGEYTLLKTISSRKLTNTSVEAGVTYYYMVRAVAGDVYSEYSAVQSVTVPVEVTLGVPVLTVTLNSKDKPIISWDAVDGAEKYEVWRAVGESGEYTLLKTISSRKLTNTSVEAAVTYYYKVRAVVGNVYSEYSAAVSVTVPAKTALAAPALTVTNKASTGKIILSWSAVENAEKYEIWYSTSKNGTYTRLWNGKSTAVTHSSAKTGTTYYYKVRAVAGDVYGEFSAIKSRTCDLARPTVTITLNSKGKPVISWKAVTGAVKYEVYRSTSKNSGYTLLWTGSSTKLTNTSVEEGVTYYYKVRAICSVSSGSSAYSTVKSVTVE